MIDKAAIIRNAQKFLSKGQIDKAIAEWQKVASSYPDGNTFNFLGDLYLKKGDKTSAMDEFRKAAKVYMDEGFSLKALAIFKKVLNIDPQDTKALIALGRLNEEKNIFTDAIKYYLAAADALSKKNKRNELLEIYNKILSLAPKNIQLKVKIAELFSKEAFIPEAAREYCLIGQIYSEKGDTKNALAYLMKSSEIQPNNRDVLLELSRLFERSGDLDKAISYAETALEKAGEDSGLLLRKAHLLLAKGSSEEAGQVLARVVQAEPDNAEARKEMALLYQKTGQMDMAWQEYSAVIDSIVSASPGEAIEILEAFRDSAPVDNRKRLAALYRQHGEIEKAFHELCGLHDVYVQKGMKSEAIESIREALELQPEDTDARLKLESLEGEASVTMPADRPMDFAPTSLSDIIDDSSQTAEEDEPALRTPSMEETGDAAGTGVQPEVQQKPLEVALTEADVFLRYGLYNDARDLLEGMKAEHSASIDLHQKLKTVYKETKDIEQAVTECIVLSTLYSRAGNEAASEAALKEASEINPKDPRLEPRQEQEIPAAEAPGPAAPRTLDDFGEELSEADFYVQQGFYKEAADIYRKLLGYFPDNGELKTKLAEMESKLSEATPGGAPLEEAEVPSGAGSLLDGFEIPDFDMPEVEETEEPDLGDDIMEIFNEFKKGLENEIEAEDAETHYNLGIAYKEMGLLDDAIKEFQTAQRDPNFFVTSCTMLGISYMQKGLYPLSIDSFSAALMKTDPKDETAWSLKYDLATAYEKNGDHKQALQMYTEVNGWNPGFRDVGDRLEAMKKTVGALPPRQKSGPDTPGKQKKDRVSYI